jgi:cell division protease FtsH
VDLLEQENLISKAVAGEAQVPFFLYQVLILLFVGCKSRVRDLFKQAKRNHLQLFSLTKLMLWVEPEGNMSGGNDERENTLNQLLLRWMVLGTNTNVIVLAATNRADVFDKA